jgi:beta-N-acetylhexosaminidase
MPGTTPNASDLELRAKIARLLVVGFRGTTIAQTGPISMAIANGLGGVILFDRDGKTGGVRNIRTPAQLAALIGHLRDQAPGRRLIVAIDQEGGRVIRLTPARGFPAAASEAAIGSTDDVPTADAWGSSIAQTLAAAGISLNLAPVVDLNVNPHNPAIGALGRSFSSDPAVVIRLASAEIDAHHRVGVRTCLKHFPGLGSATSNTDLGVADVTATWSRKELEPFRQIVASGRADTIMAGHLVNRHLDLEHPASLSRSIVTDLLRGELGWQGVVVTDDLQAGAITARFGSDEAIALAIEAGNDLLLFANQQTYDPAIVDHVVDAVVRHIASGRIPEGRIDESIARLGDIGNPPA